MFTLLPLALSVFLWLLSLSVCLSLLLCNLEILEFSPASIHSLPPTLTKACLGQEPPTAWKPSVSFSSSKCLSSICLFSAANAPTSSLAWWAPLSCSAIVLLYLYSHIFCLRQGRQVALSCLVMDWQGMLELFPAFIMCMEECTNLGVNCVSTLV